MCVRACVRACARVRVCVCVCVCLCVGGNGVFNVREWGIECVGNVGMSVWENRSICVHGQWGNECVDNGK